MTTEPKPTLDIAAAQARPVHLSAEVLDAIQQRHALSIGDRVHNGDDPMIPGCLGLMDLPGCLVCDADGAAVNDRAELINEVWRLQDEVKRLDGITLADESLIADLRANLEAFSEFDGNEDCWAMLKEQRDKAIAELRELRERCERLEVEVSTIVSELQRRLQPSGSPPPGDRVILAQWIIRHAASALGPLLALSQQPSVSAGGTEGGA